jgi:hypothetical protein
MPLIKDIEKRQRNAMAYFGCDEHQAIHLNDSKLLRLRGSKAMRYLSQRQSAFKRGIGWEITFPQWLSVWQQSGKFDDRGVGKGRYCMARKGDVGPYKVGNVSIESCVKNSRDGIAKARPAMALSYVSPIGTGRGWTRREVKKKTSCSYQVLVGKKYIGSFLTQQAAEEAYRVACAIHCHQSNL